MLFYLTTAQKKNIFAKEALKSVLEELKKVKSVEKKKGASSDKGRSHYVHVYVLCKDFVKSGLY